MLYPFRLPNVYYLTGNDIEWSNVDGSYDEEINLDLQSGLVNGIVDMERFESDDQYRDQVISDYYEGNPTIVYKFSKPYTFEILHNTNTNDVILSGDVPDYILTEDGRQELERRYEVQPVTTENGDKVYQL